MSRNYCVENHHANHCYGQNRIVTTVTTTWESNIGYIL